MHWAVWTQASSHLTCCSHIRQCCAQANKPCRENTVTGHCGRVLCYMYSLHLMAQVPTSSDFYHMTILWHRQISSNSANVFTHSSVLWYCLSTSFPLTVCLVGFSDKWLKFACGGSCFWNIPSAFVHRELLLHTPDLLGCLWTFSQLRCPGKQTKVIGL